MDDGVEVDQDGQIALLEDKDGQPVLEEGAQIDNSMKVDLDVQNEKVDDTEEGEEEENEVSTSLCEADELPLMFSATQPAASLPTTLNDNKSRGHALQQKLAARRASGSGKLANAATSKRWDKSAQDAVTNVHLSSVVACLY
jgi:hypothetical protein